MSAYFIRLKQLVLALIALTVVGHAQAHATWAEIKLIKKVKGGSKQKFDFRISGAEHAFRVFDYYSDVAYPKVTLKPISGTASSRWYYIEAGTNTITEDLPNGFSFASVSCRRKGGWVKERKGYYWAKKWVAAGELKITVNKSAGSFRFASYWLDKITCTITNVIDKPEPPTLIVKKITNGRTGTFKFSGTGTAGEFSGRTLTTVVAGQAVATEAIALKAGALTITESEVTDFKFVGAICNVGRKRLATTVKLTQRTVKLTMPKTGQVVCTFTNKYVPPPVEPPTIVVRKVTVGGIGKFTFSGSGTAGSFDDRVLKTTQVDVAVETLDIPLNKGGGSLTITEAKADGFVLTGVKCVAGKVSLRTNVNAIKGTANVWIPNTGQVVCTFTNKYIPPDGPPTIIIRKITNGGIGTFKFSAKGVGTFTRSLTTTKPEVAATTPVITLDKGGALTITESAADNFTLSSAVCKSGTTTVSSFNSVKRSVSAVIPATGAVVCTFTNTYVPPAKPPIVVINKITKGGVGTFSFTGSGVGTFTKSVTTAKAGEVAATPKIVLKRAGSLTITEAASDNFVLIGAVCKSGTTTISSFNLANRSVTAAVPAESKVVCTFTNKYIPPPEPPTIIVKKISKGGTGVFKFSGSGKAGSFVESVKTTTAGEAKASPKITLTRGGKLSITEEAKAGYTLIAASCTHQVKGGSVKKLNIHKRFKRHKIIVRVPQTGHVACTFTNKFVPPPEPPTIIVKKITIGGTGTFKFSGSGKAGSFTQTVRTTAAGEAKASPKVTLTRGGKLSITEEAKAGYTLIAASCTHQVKGGSVKKLNIRKSFKNHKIFVRVPKVGHVVCTFTNKFVPPPEPPKIIVRKITKGGFGTFEFTGSGTAGAFTRSVSTKATDVVAAAPVFKLPRGGKLTITEGPKPGYTLIAAKCTVEVKGHAIKDLAIDGSQYAKRQISLTIPKTGLVVCTFINKYKPPVEPPTIIVRKITKGGVGTFTFSGAGPAGTFDDVSVTTVEAGEVEASAPIKLIGGGELTITEAEVKGYGLIAASCQVDKKDLRARINKKRRFIKISVPKTGQVVCTFVNRKGGGTITIISNFLKRRAEWLTGDTGRPRLIERRRDRYARSSLKDGWGINGQGTDREGRIGYRTSLSKLGGSLRETTVDKAARLGVDAAQYGNWDEPAYRGGWDIWTEGSWSYFKSDGGSVGGTASSGQFGLVRGGIDYLVNPGLLIGVLVQYDYLRERAKGDAAAHASGEGGFDISGHGWMAGPYLEYELTKNLFFDAKGLIGTSLNQVSPYGTFSDEFTTTRWLLAARLTGSWQWRDSERSYWHFSPRAEVVWFNEESEDFVDSEGYLVAGQEVHLGRFKAGPELSYRYTTREGTILEPRVAAQALWSFSRSGDAKGGGLDPATISSVKDVPLETFQMRFEAGLKVEDQHGQRLEIEANYTGLGAQGHQAIGGKVGVTIPLQTKSEPQ